MEMRHPTSNTEDRKWVTIPFVEVLQQYGTEILMVSLSSVAYTSSTVSLHCKSLHCNSPQFVFFTPNQPDVSLQELQSTLQQCLLVFRHTQIFQWWTRVEGQLREYWSSRQRQVNYRRLALWHRSDRMEEHAHLICKICMDLTYNGLTHDALAFMLRGRVELQMSSVGVLSMWSSSLMQKFILRKRAWNDFM